MSDVTPLRPENEPEDPFEALLDEESDEDFGYVVTRDRASSGDSHPVKLAEWKAQDFASIYTRFRPHLERHARRFLNNQSQVDEVVQDAFLYLMVSLPELDSEIGVLRFLKWKTRLLCLDVIRASGKAYITNIDDVAEPVSTDPEVSAALEQQDDAAVIRLAMSKLNPRHREVLLASMYEEKTTLQIAEQVGLSENATRQLVFRARSAFKKALLGDDVNTDGMSAAAILSVAARKAAAEAKKAGAQAMVFALFLVLAVGALFNFTGRNPETQQLAESQAPTPVLTQQPTSTSSETSESVQNPTPSVAEPTENNDARAVQPEQISVLAANPAPSETPWNPWDLDELLEDSPTETLVLKASSVNKSLEKVQRYIVGADQGIVAEFDFAVLSQTPFKNVRLTLSINGDIYYSDAVSGEFQVETDEQGMDHYVYTGALGPIRDEAGNAWVDQVLTHNLVRIELVITPDSEKLVGSFLNLVPKRI